MGLFNFKRNESGEPSIRKYLLKMFVSPGKNRSRKRTNSSGLISSGPAFKTVFIKV